MIPITRNGVKVPKSRSGKPRTIASLHETNPFNPDNTLTEAPDDDELWARKVQAWRDANTSDLSGAHRGVKFREDAHPNARVSWWKPMLDRVGDRTSITDADGNDVTPDRTAGSLEEALAAGWKEPEHPSQPMVSPLEQRLSAEVAAKTPVRGPSEAQRRAIAATRSSAGGRPGVLTGMEERGV